MSFSLTYHVQHLMDNHILLYKTKFFFPNITFYWAQLRKNFRRWRDFYIPYCILMASTRISSYDDDMWLYVIDSLKASKQRKMRKTKHSWKYCEFFGVDIFGWKFIIDEKSQLPVLNVNEGRSTFQILQVDVLEDPSVDDHVIFHLDTEEVLNRVTRWIFFLKVWTF